MISFLLLNTRPLELSPDAIFERFAKVAEPYGGKPDVVIVSRKEHLPASAFNAQGRFFREGCFDWVDLDSFETAPLALRDGFCRCVGTLVMGLDDIEHATERMYERLVAGAKYPVKSAGTTLIADGYGTAGEELGLKRYTGPLAFPFTIRRSAIEETGLLPPVTGQSVEAMLGAYTMMLNASGWWVAGARA